MNRNTKILLIVGLVLLLLILAVILYFLFKKEKLDFKPLKNRNRADYCLEAGSGDKVLMNNCSDIDGQKLALDKKDRLVFKNNKCLDINRDNIVFQAECNDKESQKWISNNEEYKSKENTSKCLDLHGGDNVTVLTWDCHGGLNQKWYWD